MEERSRPQQVDSTTNNINIIKSRVLDIGIENFEVSDEPTWNATMTMPGLTFESLDRDGKPTTQSLMLFGGLCREYAMHIPYDEYGSVYLDWPKLTDGILTFMVATDISVSREMYDKTISKKKFDAKCMLGHVSNSSVTSLIWLSLPGRTKPIFVQVNVLVSVSTTTRKAIPLPDWFKERYQGRGALDKSLRVVPLERPNDTFVYKVKVAWSDTDIYNHTNFSSYVRFAVDALHAAILDEKSRSEKKGTGMTSSDTSQDPDDHNKALKGLTKEIIKNGLRNVKILYLKECLEGQVVDAHIWQEPGTPCVVKCAMESFKTDICHLTLEYFDSSL